MQNRNRVVLTRELAYAAGHDAANRSMRTNGRSVWNADDYNTACDVTNGLLDRLERAELTDAH